jgi:LmbE family N-acetylglucosaminyl deacetylase
MGEGPVVGLPALRRALVLAPHPDDETIGPGGTLALLAAAGTAVTVVVVTGGETTPGTGLPPEQIVRRRAAEATQACARLGLSAPMFLEHPDGNLCRRLPAMAADLTALLTSTAPDAVFLPWFGDGHPDHQALTDALALTARDPDAAPNLDAKIEVWAYETWTPLPATRLVDITAMIDAKRAALEAHVTARAAFDLDAMTGLNRYRSVHGLAGRGWAEAFLVAPVHRYLEWAAASGRSVPSGSHHG